MPTLKVIRCVECPMMDNMYIEARNCRKCTFYLNDFSRSIGCDYTPKKEAV